MAHYLKVRPAFLPFGLVLSVAVAAAGQGHGVRNPRIGKGGNQAKLNQRAAQQHAQQQRAMQQRAEQQRAEEQRARRRSDAQQDRARTGNDQPRSQSGQQPNRTVLDQQKSQPGAGQNQPAGPARALPIRPEQQRAMILERVGLSQEQRERMVKITHSHDTEAAETGRRVRQAQRGVDEAIMNPQFNEAEVNRRIEDLAQAQADRVRLQQRMRAEIRQVLTPEQVIKFNQAQRELQQKQQELRRIEMLQQSPDKSPSGELNQSSHAPTPDMIDVFLARGK